MRYSLHVIDTLKKGELQPAPTLRHELILPGTMPAKTARYCSTVVNRVVEVVVCARHVAAVHREQR